MVNCSSVKSISEILEAKRAVPTVLLVGFGVSRNQLHSMWLHSLK